MKTTLALSAVVAAIAVFSQGALAQSASSPTRAEVKAEAKAEAKSGQLSATGDAMTKQGKSAPPKTSDTTKEARKATTQADIKAGKMEPTGDAMTKEGGKQKP